MHIFLSQSEKFFFSFQYINRKTKRKNKVYGSRQRDKKSIPYIKKNIHKKYTEIKMDPNAQSDDPTSLLHQEGQQPPEETRSTAASGSDAYDDVITLRLVVDRWKNQLQKTLGPRNNNSSGKIIDQDEQQRQREERREARSALIRSTAIVVADTFFAQDPESNRYLLQLKDNIIRGKGLIPTATTPNSNSSNTSSSRRSSSSTVPPQTTEFPTNPPPTEASAGGGQRSASSSSSNGDGDGDNEEEKKKQQEQKQQQEKEQHNAYDQDDAAAVVRIQRLVLLAEAFTLLAQRHFKRSEEVHTEELNVHRSEAQSSPLFRNKTFEDLLTVTESAGGGGLSKHTSKETAPKNTSIGKKEVVVDDDDDDDDGDGHDAVGDFFTSPGTISTNEREEALRAVNIALIFGRLVDQFYLRPVSYLLRQNGDMNMDGSQLVDLLNLITSVFTDIFVGFSFHQYGEATLSPSLTPGTGAAAAAVLPVLVHHKKILALQRLRLRLNITFQRTSVIAARTDLLAAHRIILFFRHAADQGKKEEGQEGSVLGADIVREQEEFLWFWLEVQRVAICYNLCLCARYASRYDEALFWILLIGDSPALAVEKQHIELSSTASQLQPTSTSSSSSPELQLEAIASFARDKKTNTQHTNGCHIAAENLTLNCKMPKNRFLQGYIKHGWQRERISRRRVDRMVTLLRSVCKECPTPTALRIFPLFGAAPPPDPGSSLLLASISASNAGYSINSQDVINPAATTPTTKKEPKIALTDHESLVYEKDEAETNRTAFEDEELTQTDSASALLLVHVHVERYLAWHTLRQLEKVVATLSASSALPPSSAAQPNVKPGTTSTKTGGGGSVSALASTRRAESTKGPVIESPVQAVQPSAAQNMVEGQQAGSSVSSPVTKKSKKPGWGSWMTAWLGAGGSSNGGGGGGSKGIGKNGSSQSSSLMGSPSTSGMINLNSVDHQKLSRDLQVYLDLILQSSSLSRSQAEASSQSPGERQVIAQACLSVCNKLISAVTGGSVTDLSPYFDGMDVPDAILRVPGSQIARSNSASFDSSGNRRSHLAVSSSGQGPSAPSRENVPRPEDVSHVSRALQNHINKNLSMASNDTPPQQSRTLPGSQFTSTPMNTSGNNPQFPGNEEEEEADTNSDREREKRLAYTRQSLVRHVFITALDFAMRHGAGTLASTLSWELEREAGVRVQRTSKGAEQQRSMTFESGMSAATNGFRQQVTKRFPQKDDNNVVVEEEEEKKKKTAAAPPQTQQSASNANDNDNDNDDNPASNNADDDNPSTPPTQDEPQSPASPVLPALPQKPDLEDTFITFDNLTQYFLADTADLENELISFDFYPDSCPTPVRRLMTEMPLRAHGEEPINEKWWWFFYDEEKALPPPPPKKKKKVVLPKPAKKAVGFFSSEKKEEEQEKVPEKTEEERIAELANKYNYRNYNDYPEDEEEEEFELERRKSIFTHTLDGFTPEITGFEQRGRPEDAILQSATMRQTLHKCLPLQMQGFNWRVKFSTRCDGTSMRTMLNKCGATDPIMLVVMDHHGDIFGAYMATSFESAVNKAGGYTSAGESFVWTTAPESKAHRDEMAAQKAAAEKEEGGIDEEGVFEHPVRRFKWTERNSYFLDVNNGRLKVGGGGEGPALFINEYFKDGTSYESATFDNTPLFVPDDLSNSFRIFRFEVLTFEP